MLVVERPSELDKTLVGVRVLIVEEDRDCRELFRLVLEATGATIVTVGGAREALREGLRLQPHVVVSELAMRDADGYWLARRVRGFVESGDRRPWMLAVTVDHEEHARQHALDAGFDAVLTKPVDPFEFRAVVEYLGRSPVTV